MPNHFTLTFFLLRRRDVSCSHSNRDLFTCEDNMLFSHVKISCFRAKAHLVFHWYLYNKLHFKNYNYITFIVAFTHPWRPRGSQSGAGETFVEQFRPPPTEALFLWSRVPETTLPLETTLRSVYMEL